MAERLEAGPFKALCDPSRIAVLVRLAETPRPQSVSQVAACCPTDVSVVSRHLALLRDAGVVEAERRGREVYYGIRYRGLAETLRAVADAIEACCPDGDIDEEETNHGPA